MVALLCLQQSCLTEMTTFVLNNLFETKILEQFEALAFGSPGLLLQLLTSLFDSLALLDQHQ